MNIEIKSTSYLSICIVFLETPGFSDFRLCYAMAPVGSPYIFDLVTEWGHPFFLYVRLQYEKKVPFLEETLCC